jgi:hypothetical protein
MARQVPAKSEPLLKTMMMIIGVVLTVMSIAIAFVAIRIAQAPEPISREEILRETRRYDPLFRAILLDRAFALLNDVHITEYHSELDLQRNLREIEESLGSVSAFERENRGLKKVFGLLHSLSDAPDEVVAKAFMNMSDATIQDLQPTLREAAYIKTFQGLMFVREYRQNIADQARTIYLRNARSRLESARDISRDVPNLYNGLGIVIVDELYEMGYADRSHVNAKLQEASQYFELGFLLNPSRRNYAAQVSNIASIKMEREFWRTFEIVVGEADNFRGIRVNAEGLDAHTDAFYAVLREYERALVQDGQAPSIQISIAECHAIIAMLKAHRPTSRGGLAQFDESGGEFDDAIDAVSKAYGAGFKDWPYLISRPWILAAMTASEQFRDAVIRYVRN